MDQDEELPTYTPRRAPTEPPSYTPYVQHSEGSHELDPITQETLLSSLSPPSRAYLHRIDTAITTEPKGDEAVPPGKDDAYEQHYTEPSRLYDQTYHEERRRNPKGWRRCPMKRYLCITITVLALVITGVVLFVHYRNTENSKRNSLSYESALVGSSFAITTFPASASTTNSTSSYTYVYQSFNTSIRLTYASSDYKIFTVTDFASAGTGLAHIKTTEAGQSISSSLFYVDEVGTLSELRSNTPASGWANNWTPGSLSSLSLKVSETDMNLAAGWSDASTTFPNGTAVCPGTKGYASVFYRPAENASTIQEVVWDVERDQWSKGASFNGVRAGSGITTVETVGQEGAGRWLYGIASSGGILEWRCVTCCRVTDTSRAGAWEKSNATIALPQTDPDALVLAGRANSTARILYYRGARGGIQYIWSSIPYYISSTLTSTPGFNNTPIVNLTESPTGNVGTYLSPHANFAVSEGVKSGDGVVSAGSGGAQGAEEVRILQEWVGGRVYVVQEGNGEDAHVIPDGFGGDEGYN